MTKQTIVAIWKYDLYPYFLCGEVNKFLPKGYVETKEYGEGYRMKPLKIIWGTFAHTFKYRMEKLQKDEREARKIHDQDWRAKSNELYDGEY